MIPWNYHGEAGWGVTPATATLREWWFEDEVSVCQDRNPGEPWGEPWLNENASQLASVPSWVLAKIQESEA